MGRGLQSLWLHSIQATSDNVVQKNYGEGPAAFNGCGAEQALVTVWRI
jgi:hypothetical protein